jgi:hypothetical protein
MRMGREQGLWSPISPDLAEVCIKAKVLMVESCKE